MSSLLLFNNLQNRKDFMIDNSKLSKLAKDNLKHLCYETQVMIFDTNCIGQSKCPYAVLRTIDSREVKEFETLEDLKTEALFNSKAIIQRGCNYYGEEVSLKVITSNGCRFWRPETIEVSVEGEYFIERELEECSDLRKVSADKALSQ
jgi:hypothetical protein